MHLTVASWNVDGWHTIRDEQLALLDNSGAELALLQEVTPASLERLREAGWHGASAMELVADDHVERGDARPRFACAVVGRGRVEVGDACVLLGAPSPVRTLAADVVVEGRPSRAVSAALPPGSTWGRAAKTGQARVLGEHLRAEEGPTLLGIDRNGPRFERWEPHETVWWPQDDPSLFSADADHGLTDVLVTWHQVDPARRAAAQRERPNGPMAVSSIEQRARPPVARRYDVVMASAHWAVDDVLYDYEASVLAGSDHAMVVARLGL